MANGTYLLAECPPGQIATAYGCVQSFAPAGASAAAPAGPAVTVGPFTRAATGAGGRCCGCGAGGGGGGATSLATEARELAQILEQPGPLALPWWLWVLIALVVLNLLRS